MGPSRNEITASATHGMSRSRVFSSQEELQDHIIAMDGWNDHCVDGAPPKKKRNTPPDKDASKPLASAQGRRPTAHVKGEGSKQDQKDSAHERIAKRPRGNDGIEPEAHSPFGETVEGKRRAETRLETFGGGWRAVCTS